LHLLGVVGADGTPARDHAQFLVKTPAPAPAASKSGTYEGQPWVRTTSPDGLYSLLKPASWTMAGGNGMVLLADPKGKACVLIAERLLTGYVDAQSVAQQLAKAFASGKLRVTAPFQFAGNKDRALFAGVISSGKQSLLSVNLVLPELWHHTLGVALGFATSMTAGAGKTLARIEASLASNDEAGVSAAQRWQRFSGVGLNLDYPAGWLANFTGNGPAWFVGPDTQGMIFAAAQPYSGDLSSQSLAQAGRLVEQNIASTAHKGMKVVSEQAADGIYRWLAVYPNSDGSAQNVEMGQVAVGNGRLSVVWGDSAADQLPANLPLFGRTLDSASRDAGVTPPQPITVAALISAVQNNSAVDPTQPAPTPTDTTGSGSAPLDPQAQALLNTQDQMYRSQEAFLTLSNLEMERHETFMSMMGYTYTYVPISW
jgi:hypothetical protein